MRLAILAPALLGVACARTGLLELDGEGEQGGSAGNAGTASGGSGGGADECVTSSDCPVEELCTIPLCVLDGSGVNARRRCILEPAECDDGNPCSTDRCDPATGNCVSTLPTDADRDGHFGEPPPGAPTECGGLDCDDSDATVYPGAPEQCDSRDQDCDGAIDEDFAFEQLSVQPTPLVPLERGRAAHGGLAWNGAAYGFSYHTTADRKESFFKLIDATGTDVSEETPVSRINADAYSGPIVWSGESFLTVFADARQGGNYEIYATRFSADGYELDADRRLSDAVDFSLNPVVAWTGEHYVVAWDDRRERSRGGVSQVFVRRLSSRGEPLGGETLISSAGEWSESPALAVGTRTLGVVYVVLGSGGVPRARFRAFDLELSSGTPPVDLAGSLDAIAPSIAFAGGRYFVVWAFVHAGSLPGATVHAATVDESGNPLAGGQPVTRDFSFVRAPSLVSLGDRTYLTFSGAFSDGAYDVWGSMLDTSLAAPVTTRLAQTEAQSLSPFAALGPEGTIGIVFDEHDERPPTSRRPHFMAVGCFSALE